MIALGCRVRDRVQGFSWIATARTEYLYRSPMIQVIAECPGDDGKPIDEQWFDEARLELAGERETAGIR